MELHWAIGWVSAKTPKRFTWPKDQKNRFGFDYISPFELTTYIEGDKVKNFKEWCKNHLCGFDRDFVETDGCKET